MYCLEPGQRLFDQKVQNLLRLRAAIDVSDGLSLDLARLAAASGCGAEIDPGAIPSWKTLRDCLSAPRCPQPDW